MDIKLKQYNVKVRESITYGDKEDIESILLKGAKIGASGLDDFDSSVINESKYKILEVYIEEIKKGDEIIPFSKDWVRALSIEDGDKLVDTINKVHDRKKKMIELLDMQLQGKRSADKIVIMEMLSKEYGWTPSEIRKQSSSDIQDYIKIINTKRKLENAQIKQNG